MNYFLRDHYLLNGGCLSGCVPVDVHDLQLLLHLVRALSEARVEVVQLQGTQLMQVALLHVHDAEPIVEHCDEVGEGGEVEVDDGHEGNVLAEEVEWVQGEHPLLAGAAHDLDLLVLEEVARHHQERVARQLVHLPDLARPCEHLLHGFDQEEVVLELVDFYELNAFNCGQGIFKWI